jgi:hypothetical protein
MIWRSLMAPNSKNYDGYQFTRTKSTWKPNFSQIGGFLYFGGHFEVDYDVANWYPSLVCYGGHFESKMTAKIQKSSDLGKIWFPSRLWCCELISIIWFATMDINSQHHNLLGNQISFKSEDFCILVAILDSKVPP